MPRDLVLLHGALGAGTTLAPLAACLGSAFRVHTLDFEGHGSAGVATRPFRMAHFVENVRLHLDRAGVEQAAVFGYSMGGYVALALALAHPERVTRVATLGTKFRWDPATAAREAARLDAQAIHRKVPAFAEVLAQRHAGAGGWERVLAATAEMLHALGDAPVLTDETLTGLALPVRVMVGDRDATVTVEEALAVARLLPAGELQVLPGTPHPLEQVDLPTLDTALRGFAGAH